MLKIREISCKTLLNKSDLAEFTDTKANLEALFRALKGLDLDKIYVDRLNIPRWGVLESLKKGLSREEYA